MAQNAVRGRGMKVKIRKGELTQELLALQRHGVSGADGKTDITAIGALEQFRLERRHVVDGFGEPLPEFIEALFGVGGGRHLAMRQARAAFCGEIASKLDLAAKRQHVRIQPRTEQHLGLDILRLAVRFGLAEEARETAQNLQERRNGSVVEGHVMLFSVDEEGFGILAVQQARCAPSPMGEVKIKIEVAIIVNLPSSGQPTLPAEAIARAARRASAPAIRRWAMNRRAGRI